jgi:splicing factor 3A subunit 2
MSKPGSGGVMSATNANVDRRERLRQLALETIDLKKDPYILRNHLGSIECKLCLTLHTNEGSYLAHTQGKRHQQNLARRAAKMALKAGGSVALDGHIAAARKQKLAPRKTQKIGTPGYKIIKQRDPTTGQLSVLFRLMYSNISENIQPRHRFMSSVEQKIEAHDLKFQYILFAADPYDTGSCLDCAYWFDEVTYSL